MASPSEDSHDGEGMGGASSEAGLAGTSKLGRTNISKPAPESDNHAKVDIGQQDVLDDSQDSQATIPSAATDCTSPPRTQDTLLTQVTGTQQSMISTNNAGASGSGVGFLANRRSASFLKSQESCVQSILPSSSAPASSTPTLGRASSYLRLSTTEDGHAQVIDRAVKSPSPPKVVDALPQATSLRRSYSAAGLHDRLKQTDGESLVRKFPRTSLLGRSRDSRVWEFWCDKDARNSLAAKADSEMSGSAADAIGQIVASNKALRPNGSRRNLALGALGAQHTARRPLTSVDKLSKPALRRSSTTHGRMQSKTQQPQVKPVSEEKGAGKGEEWEPVSTESDKENYEPEDQAQSQSQSQKQSHRRPQPSLTPRKVLGENTQLMSQTGSLGSMMARARTPRKHAGAPIEILDDDVATFMSSGGGSGRNRTGTSSGEELDCVQSLLSLSQGNWR